MTEAPHARLTSRNGGQAVFDGMRVDGRVHGMLLDITATQTFRNPGSAHIELVYSFPLPADAVLLAMTVRLGERRLTGTVVEKILAAGRYEDSLTAILRAGAEAGAMRLADPRLTTMALIGMLTGVTNWYREGGRLDRRAVADHYRGLVRGAVGAG